MRTENRFRQSRQRYGIGRVRGAGLDAHPPTVRAPRLVERPSPLGEPGLGCGVVWEQAQNNRDPARRGQTWRRLAERADRRQIQAGQRTDESVSNAFLWTRPTNPLQSSVPETSGLPRPTATRATKPTKASLPVASMTTSASSMSCAISCDPYELAGGAMDSDSILDHGA